MKFNGNILKQLRVNSGLSLKEWLALLEIPKSTLYSYEGNLRKPTAANMLKICNKLDKKIDFFYS